MYECIKCGRNLVDEARFCSYCGARQPKNPICPKCGEKLPRDAKFCHLCGANIKTDIMPSSVRPFVSSFDKSKIGRLSSLSRESICTSKKGFYSGDEIYSLFRIKYFSYMGSLYHAEKYDDHYKIIAVSEEHSTETVVAQISAGTLNNVRIAAVNATGIYVIAVLKENEWFKTVIHRVGHDGEMIKSISLETAENNNLRDMDICGSKIYYRTTSDDYFNVVYIYDAETDKRTLAYKSDGQRKILNIIGADGEVYIKIAFTNTLGGEEYTDCGWYVYSIADNNIKCISSDVFPPSMVLEKPEIYVRSDPAYIPPEDRKRISIVSIDVVKNIMWYAEEDKAASRYRIYSAPIGEPEKRNTEVWEIDSERCPFKIGKKGLNVKGYRLFFDGANMYWAPKFYEFYSFSPNGMRSLTASESKIGDMPHFEVFDKTFYLPDHGAKRIFFHRNNLRRDDSMEDMMWQN